MRWPVLALALVLSGCGNSYTREEIEAKVSDTLVTICLGVDVAWFAFEAYKAGNEVKPSLVLKVHGAYSAAKAVCAAPPRDTAEAISAAIKAYGAFNEAVREAKLSAG
jgi:hypothetical protein